MEYLVPLVLLLVLLALWLIVRSYNRKFPGADLGQGSAQPKEHPRCELVVGPITERNGHPVARFLRDGGEAHPAWAASHQADRDHRKVVGGL